jgi:hypothetical protein
MMYSDYEEVCNTQLSPSLQRVWAGMASYGTSVWAVAEVDGEQRRVCFLSFVSSVVECSDHLLFPK